MKIVSLLNKNEIHVYFNYFQVKDAVPVLQQIGHHASNKQQLLSS
jgi:hypothetical protein